MKFERALSNSLKYLHSFGRLYFTPKQLYYVFCRTSGNPFTADMRKYFGLFNRVSGLLRSGGSPKTPIAWEVFSELLSGHMLENRIDGLLQTERKVTCSQEFSPDLTLYGLPKMLICEDDETASMLRANQFHLQTPCAVTSLSETVPLSEIFRGMLARAENPEVLFLHDASLESLTKIGTVRQMIQLDDAISFRPIGLRPVHAMRLNLFVTRTNRRDFDFSGLEYLNEDEQRWLTSGNTAEISSVSPVRLLRVLRRLILGLESLPGTKRVKFPKKELGFM